MRMPVRHHAGRGSWRALFVAVLIAAGGLAGIQQAGAAPTATVTGLERQSSLVSPDDAQVVKTRFATCSSTAKAVIGGGAVINDHNAHRVMLTELRPVDSSPDGYFVEARMPAGFSGNWTLQAYVVCADAGPLSGWELRSGSPNVYRSDTVQDTQAGCTNNRKVIGTGAAIDDPSNSREVGLQTFRSDADRNAGKSWVREDASGYAGSWRPIAYAICTDPVPGTAISGVLREGSTADVLCPYSPNITYVAGSGGGAGPSAVFLQTVLPSVVSRRRLDVAMTGTEPTGIIAQAICVPIS